MDKQHQQVYALKASRCNYDEATGELIVRIADPDLENFPRIKEWPKSLWLHFPENNLPHEYWVIDSINSLRDDFFNSGGGDLVIIRCFPAEYEEDSGEPEGEDIFTRISSQLETIIQILIGARDRE